MNTLKSLFTQGSLHMEAFFWRLRKFNSLETICSMPDSLYGQKPLQAWLEKNKNITSVPLANIMII